MGACVLRGRAMVALALGPLWVMEMVDEDVKMVRSSFFEYSHAGGQRSI